ncbi:preprotein translocase subunit SecY [Candidatus Uhrbacteria bacterium RIFCSPLOWO2_01_FULL_47_24]|uniref:Protein translocase subunit SecY n=1 Tax=Candidatus Uhrbacteria bacterium RIFCSPLOWO2_01_FULL_47_24 TaxID=1802401 RepID=A0A1F7UTP5_9BACT|nr:MAG: preprotein translocase subunit SecY [Candidatus Uhrbacteria bacterium RIFCSPHIGHO2_01_FULL_47_11]OGL68962.1 MAG: preprotein translocase subunit SecY [Candidatus Uhrbacteria bacterium RIFCSPHIGHO2_02_FULL_46_47]OGL74921.1 MAG: preprotein translocase subunit SecY [Candidatus Uhrbacteria bacterium RIFCSPHIGHO2_12_FULL_47_11]OGL81662.1 MAG: preprotein translocase subunit SecY [Candidatus Uhrbacteria bacterium RIFCSPLOWO2_01_FULL_47_24]OGL85085.1 MAG: preprotein translocase subunit SecY [Can
MNRVLNTIVRIWRLRDLRRSVLFVLAMLFAFRVAAHIPIPGVDLQNLKAFFQSNEILGLLNIFSGGTMENFSVVALGIAPYITASIIFQLLAMVIPALEAIQKEGEAGQRKINQWTRYATVPLAVLQAFGMITLLKQSPRPILGSLTVGNYALMILTLVAGTLFLMWIGELISERKIGNGISLLIFAGIVASLPTNIQQALVTFDAAQITNFILFAVISMITIVGVVLITQAQRNIPVSYARRVRGMRMYGGVDTHLPLRVNMAGVIPIIFAISIILFPPMVAQFFLQARSVFIVRFAQWIIGVFQNNLVYGILYFVLVFIFTYFYTAVVFHPSQIAENLQKQGGFIPGIRPGKPTAGYLQYVTSRVILVGALFLSTIAILPLILQRVTGTQALALGGTSILIVVSVVIETLAQIEAQLTMHEYET